MIDEDNDDEEACHDDEKSEMMVDQFDNESDDCNKSMELIYYNFMNKL